MLLVKHHDLLLGVSAKISIPKTNTSRWQDDPMTIDMKIIATTVIFLS